MQLTSPAFEHNQPIPDKYTCRGEGVNPPLMISGVPAGAQCLALYVHDPDAPGKDFTHWTVWNISATATTILENHAPSGAAQGLNDFGKPGWGPPCPPSGTHRYIFELYALNRQLSLQSGAHSFAFTALLAEHSLAKAELIGTVTA